MTKKANIKLDIKSILSILLFAAGILAVLYYILVAQRVEFDSDFTDTVIWAEAMLTGNGLFDKTMSYAYTLPFGGSLLMAPFVAIFGLGYTAHAAGFVLFLAIFVFALYKMLRGMNFSANESMVASGIILLLSLATKDTRMTMWGHIIHYSLGLLFVVIAMAVYSKIDIGSFDISFLKSKTSGEENSEDGNSENTTSNHKKFAWSKIKWIVVLAVITALFCTNGLTTILFFFIPFFGAVIIERFIIVEEDLFCKKNINSLSIAVICGIAGVFGYAVSKLLQRGVITVYDDMFKTIPMWQSWIWDFTERIRCFIVCTAGEINNDVPMESFTGIRIMYMALYGFILLVIPFIAIFSYRKMENKIMRMYFIAYYILLLATLFVYDFSTARGTAHRLVGLYMTAVICSVIYMMWLIKNASLARFGYVLAIAFAVASLFCCFNTVSLRGQNRYDRLTNVLKENDLKYGYAEYWSAQVTTILSNNDVEVCPINVREDGGISKRLYNIREWQFDTRDGVDRYFAFLSAWEYETVKDTYASNAIDVIQFDDDGYILIFDHNIF